MRPFCHLNLNTVRSDSCAFHETLRSVGGFVRARGLELGLTQQECAKGLDISKRSLENWENSRTTPDPKHMGRLVQFLGFSPFKKPTAAGAAVGLVQPDHSQQKAAIRGCHFS